MSPRSLIAAVSAWSLATGCVVAAVGAGAGGGIYFTERGVESVVPVSVERAGAATKRAFADLKIQQTKTSSEASENGGEKREVDGTGNDRDISVTLKSEGSNSTRVQVVAKKSAVTWDKDFARTIVDKIVAYSR
ncbi:MAG TPA: DUF3568 family protein [Gemmatimonadales bacterium]|nr:DUF3568 family protein [Gemmatimonadales bacterium]